MNWIMILFAAFLPTLCKTTLSAGEPSKDTNEKNINSYPEKENSRKTINLRSQFEDLCSNQDFKTILCTKCRCYYKTIYTSYVRWPVEELHTNPKILRFVNVISAKEITTLKEEAIPQLEESAMFSEDGEVFNEHRKSFTAWIDTLPVTEEITSRIKDITGFDASVSDSYSCSEDLQVVYYNTGGLYSLHYDFLGESDDLPEYIQGTGDRLATLMFCLEEPSEGGHTVFPLLNLAIKPTAGSAILWYNLHRDGTSDLRTLHGGCPVLRGHKWIANKWIHEICHQPLPHTMAVKKLK